MEITKEYIAKEHADIAAAFRADGEKSVDVAAIRAEAAKAERERIQSVLSMQVPGSESLINEMAFDGKTTGPEAAVKILQSEKQKGTALLASMAADAGNLAGVVASPAVDPGKAPHPGADAPLEERCKYEWDASASLRNEFGGDYGSYEAYTRANEYGLVRVHTGAKRT